MMGSYVARALLKVSSRRCRCTTCRRRTLVLSHGGIGELLAEPRVGRPMWEDSMEFQAQYQQGPSSHALVPARKCNFPVLLLSLHFGCLEW
ncbi:hypothetical protein PM082_008251 [Marasmius tenuissimus]|nr:hypothetical protein PM082_008251 [Marasmius tenuissimus]